MKILLTGAAGYLGSNLTQYLLERDHTVIAIDNFNNYYSPKIKEYNIKEFENNSNFRLYRIDLLDVEALDKVFKKERIEAIIHFAALAHVTRSITEAADYVRNNEEATVNVAEMAVKYNVGNFIFASTCSIYGHNPIPSKETENTDHPLAPYPATKKANEVMLSTYNLNHGLNVNIIRIFNPVAPRLRPDLALALLFRAALYDEHVFKQYWSDATRTSRDYIYAFDMFDAISVLLEKPFEYEIFNIGNSYSVTLAKLIDVVGEVVGKRPKIEIVSERPGEVVDTFADITKAREMIGFDPKTTIEESVEISYKWFKDQEEWYKRGQF